MGRPVVNVAAAEQGQDVVPRVGLDRVATGRMAGEYLLEQGFAHLAFLGYEGLLFVAQELAGLASVMKPAGREIATYYVDAGQAARPDDSTWAKIDESMRRWLVSLPKPVAVLACADFLGVQLAELCRHSRLRVPGDVAILGVDDDELLCELAQPPLSSVKIPSDRVGYEAAAAVDQLIRGKPLQRQALELPPIRVEGRGSTDVLAEKDAEVAAAIRFIREHGHEPIGVTDLLRKAPLSRRSLERKFRQALGRSPLEEIRRARADLARDLLAMTDLPLSAISTRCGFATAEWLSTVFQKESGILPLDYRRLFRGE